MDSCSEEPGSSREDNAAWEGGGRKFASIVLGSGGGAVGERMGREGMG